MALTHTHIDFSSGESVSPTAVRKDQHSGWRTATSMMHDQVCWVLHTSNLEFGPQNDDPYLQSVHFFSACTPTVPRYALARTLTTVVAAIFSNYDSVAIEFALPHPCIRRVTNTPDRNKMSR